MSATGYTKTECPFCGQHIEVPDALAADWIACPNETCGKSFPPTGKKSGAPPREFALPPAATPRQPASQAIKDAAAAPAKPKPGQPASGAAGLLDFGAVLLLLAGCGLVLSGFSSEMDEARKLEGSAIRQTVYAVQYGSGLIVVALSLVIAALVRIIRKP